jgi:hypothetical protein
MQRNGELKQSNAGRRHRRLWFELAVPCPRRTLYPCYHGVKGTWRFAYLQLCGSVWQLVAACGSLWQRVAACGSVWQLVWQLVWHLCGVGRILLGCPEVHASGLGERQGADQQDESRMLLVAWRNPRLGAGKCDGFLCAPPPAAVRSSSGSSWVTTAFFGAASPG